ncbi:zinc-finger domain-containing protein [Halobacillus naozhouensis]
MVREISSIHKEYCDNCFLTYNLSN